MLHSCGQTHFQTKLLTNGGFTEDFESFQFSNETIERKIDNILVKLPTAYLGIVKLNLNKVTDNLFSLENYHIVGGKKLLVKVVDAQQHNLTEKQRYSRLYLENLSSKVINVVESYKYYYLTLLCQKKIAQLNKNVEKCSKFTKKIEELVKLTDPNIKQGIAKGKTLYPELHVEQPNKNLSHYKQLYKKNIEYNSAIDVIFNSVHYLDFLYKSTGIVSVNNLNSIISISGVPNLDNAFFTGEYMVYGNGKNSFYPLTAIDIVGHELSHGLVKGTADLEYKGHSGALNESFADIMGTMFEFYMYEKFPNLLGEKDWFIGEDLGINKPFLRSMEDPNKGRQPCSYKGEYYMDPNGQIDFGGVHINSGITNYCFYLASQQEDKNKMLEYFIVCLKSLNKTSNFMNFRDNLKLASNNNQTILNVLNKVGLTDQVMTDYGKSPQPQPQPIPQPIPQRIPQRIPQPIPQPYPQPYPQRIPQPWPQPQIGRAHV